MKISKTIEVVGSIHECCYNVAGANEPSPARQWPTKLFRVWELGRSPQDSYEVDADDFKEALAIAEALGIKKPMVKLEENR